MSNQLPPPPASSSPQATPINPQPTPVSFSVGMITTVRQADQFAQTFVTLKMDTWVGSAIYFLDSLAALEMGRFLTDVGEQVKRVEFLPPDGSAYKGPRAEDGAVGVMGLSDALGRESGPNAGA